MPRLEDDVEQHNGFDGLRQRAAGFWEAFSNFALRDNVLEVAVGLM
jgi:large conductance mechanosensitive channel